MTAKAARNSRSNTRVSLTLAAVAAQATGTPSPLVAMWYLVPRLPRSVGLGPVRSPPRLARTEQASRIRVAPRRRNPLGPEVEQLLKHIFFRRAVNIEHQRHLHAPSHCA